MLRFKLGKSPADVDRALRYVVREAYRDVPYYRRAWDEAGIGPEAIRGAGDLGRLPVTPRERLLGAEEEGFLNERVDADRLFRATTSGSTAVPVTVFLSRTELYFRRVSLMVALGRNVKLRYPLTIVDVGALRGRGSKDVIQRLGIVRVVHLKRTMALEEQVRLIQKGRAQIVQGRPSSLALVAEELSQRGIRSVRPAVVITFAEMLHRPVRELLEDVFACRVVDHYNCEEAGNVVWQCPEDASLMHINHDVCMVEVVDDDGQATPSGSEGRVLLTVLYNCTMPFVRYELGDRAALLDAKSCSCGYRGTTMTITSGRDDDHFVLPGGRLVSPRNAFQAVWDALPVAEAGQGLIHMIRGIQIVQETMESMVVRVVPGDAYSPMLWEGLAASVRTLHQGMRVRVELVDELPADRSGKVRQVVSEVPRERPDWVTLSEPVGDV